MSDDINKEDEEKEFRKRYHSLYHSIQRTFVDEDGDITVKFSKYKIDPNNSFHLYLVDLLHNIILDRMFHGGTLKTYHSPYWAIQAVKKEEEEDD